VKAVPAQSLSFLITALLLAATIGVAMAAISYVRSRFLGGASDHPGGDGTAWRDSLLGYRNLRDKGVLSDDEYRKIRTLVEPHLSDPSSREDHGH
jgi:hypothetical protein